MRIVGKLPRGRASWLPKRWVVANIEGKGLLRWIYGASESDDHAARAYLVIGDEPIAAWEGVCPTCSGILKTGHAGHAEVAEWLEELRSVTQDASYLDEESIQAFDPIVELLEPDMYAVGVVEYETVSPDGTPSLDLFGRRLEDEQSGLPWGNGDYGPRYLIPTQSSRARSPETVAGYVASIREGRRPFGIALYVDGFTSLLLDGHHKLEAYGHAGMRAPCLTIWRGFAVECRTERWKRFSFHGTWGEQMIDSADLPSDLRPLASSWLDRTRREAAPPAILHECARKLGCST